MTHDELIDKMVKAFLDSAPFPMTDSEKRDATGAFLGGISLGCRQLAYNDGELTPSQLEAAAMRVGVAMGFKVVPTKEQP